MSIDVVQPYAFITSINHLHLEQDIVPLTTRIGRDCIENKIVSVPQVRHYKIYFEVGGAINIDEACEYFHV